MYLGASIVVQMPDSSSREFSGISVDLQNAILAGGRPVRPNGSYYNTEQFMGGWLFDGCPLNVILGQGWIPGQMEALTAAGKTPYCPQFAPGGQGSVALPVSQYQPPALSQVPAPGFQLQQAGASGARLLPTGVSTATAPTIITLPGGQTQILPAQPPEQADAPPAGFLTEPWVPYAAGGLLLFFLFGRKKRG
jgi:hypothetical protein